MWDAEEADAALEEAMSTSAHGKARTASSSTRNVLARRQRERQALSRELLLHCTNLPHVVAISEFILSEVSRVLRYPRIAGHEFAITISRSTWPI